MPTYLVEAYLPRSEPAAAAPAALRAGRSQVRHRWSLLLPDEEIGFHVVDGPTLEAVRKHALRARIRCQRITEAVLISAEDIDPQGGKR